MHFPACFLLSFVLCNSIRKVHTDDYGYDYDYDYQDSRFCSMSETITGGTVTYSKKGSVGSELIYHCREGFKPYPVFKKVCSRKGEWEPKIQRVKCEEEDDYDDYEEIKKGCPVTETIKGGSVTYSKRGLEGSVLTYNCTVGHYPFPTRSRLCNSRGEWSAMFLPNGRTVSTATCKEVLCPAQLQLNDGEFWPKKQWFKVGEEQTFSCKEGFTLFGSARRNCTELGHWTGTSPVCDDQTNDCRNPGTPPGALRSGDRFHFGDKVTYRCQAGLDLLGSKMRVCLNTRVWSGPVPRCQSPYVFDSPASVAEAMSGSLSAVMDFSSPEFKKSSKRQSYGRSLQIAQGRINIFILLDTSGSIEKDEFEKAKLATAKLIEKLDSYDVIIKYDIISYAGEPKDIITVLDDNSNNVNWILKKLKEFDYSVHGNKTGTNLYEALNKVQKRLSFLKAKDDSHFSETQNVIIIETDGYLNMGGNPEIILSQIRSLMGYDHSSTDHTKEQLLDVYVFGIGEKTKTKELKRIASSKDGEQHLFLLSSYESLGQVFNMMINDTAVIKCGVAQEIETQNSNKQEATTRPWHISFEWAKSSCQASILTGNWLITAAHCFIKLNKSNVEVAKPEEVNIKHGEGKVYVSSLFIHPKFNINGLRDKKVKEFYDYDVALVKLNSTLKLSAKARPICLPCTNASNWALKLNADATCEKHKSVLLSVETPAFFTRQAKTRMQTHIQTGEKRAECIEKYRPALDSNNQVTLTDVITERFLCTGGSIKFQDHFTCKGDSGGALFLQKMMRYFQVGVVSWGTDKEACKSSTRISQRHSKDARDFHISVFAIIPWLKEHLGKELAFLPM